MKRKFLGRLVARVAVVCAATGAMAGMAQPHNILEAARQTVEDFDGSPHRTQFRATIRRADAVVIVPASRFSDSRPDRPGRPAVVVVHDGARGAWSDPAFYRVRVSGEDAPTGGAGIMFTVMKTDVVDQLTEGSATLGGADGLRVISVTTGVAPDIRINATADVLAFVDVDTGMAGPSSFDGWRLAADKDLNKTYYDEALTLETILSRGTVRTPGVERLIGGLRIAEETDTSLP